MTALKEVVVWYNGKISQRIESALDLFRETLSQRSRMAVRLSADLPDDGEPAVVVTLEEGLHDLGTGHATIEAIRSELIDLPTPGPEGYRLASQGATIVASGTDERGVLYGLGRLLRTLEIREESVTLPRPLRLSKTPKTILRGHQLGYRPKTNAYDMWSKDQYRRYIQDLALFGANAIELMPPRTDDEPKTPEMLYDQLEMMTWLSGAIHSLGLDVWIWYPNMNDDFGDSNTIGVESAEREEVFSSLPHIDAVMIPGGDPGHQDPAVLFEWGRIQAEILRRHHPDAQLWISAQISDATPAWIGAFLQELGKEPEWLTGVSHGPWVKGDVAEFRASIPPRYPVRRYPDITHSLSCQYPVRDWDPVFAATLGRECYNPRPLDHKRIHNAYVDHAIGSLSYSEGINDDVNKFVWSDQDWDPDTPVRETLKDFARLFISPDHVEEISEGLLGFERNWRGPIVSNPHIRTTFNVWRNLEQRLPEAAAGNYRLVMPLVRAYYDEYIRRRSHRERGLEEQVVSIIERLNTESIDSAVARIKGLIAESTAGAEFDHLKEHCIELADRAFDLIRWQTSVTRHKGQAIVRGCFLDAIDFQISDLPFYAQAVRQAEKTDDPVAKCDVLEEALRRARPSTTGVFVDLASVHDNAAVVEDRSWEDDPSGLTIPVTVNIPAPWPSYEKPGEFQGGVSEMIPMVERSYVASFYCKPLTLRFGDLDSHKRYRVRVCYRAHRPWSGLRFAAGGRMIHDFITPPGKEATMTFALPEGCVDSHGELELVWQARPFRVYSEGLAWIAVEIDP